MHSVYIILISFFGYLIAYNTYGKWLGKKIFRLNDKNRLPSLEKQDGKDFVPTKKTILFGHHFTTIAGSGPIVGPALAVIWGWVPAVIWIFFGSIFIGAVQDFSILIISSRNNGDSTAELTRTILDKKSSKIFHVIAQFYFLILIAIFTMIMGILFDMNPQAVFPVWAEIPIALFLGALYRKKKINTLIFSILGLVLMFITIMIGLNLPIKLFAIAGSPVITWCIILYIYNFFVSIMPVQILLQPRDFINSHEVIIMMVFLIIGIVVSNPVIVAPAINLVNDAPPILPILFMTISCGAVSGAHSLFASGTTSKQIEKETDALPIGYGGMLLEGLLAIVVVIVICAGLGMNGGGSEAFSSRYSSWFSAQGLAAKLSAVVEGSSNILASIGLPKELGVGIITVFIVSFVGTTLDSSVRIQRYSLQEIFSKKNKFIRNNYWATFIVILLAMLLTFMRPNGSGAMLLWPLFGSLNQLVAALTLLLTSVYLSRRQSPFLIALLPAAFMLIMTFWALFYDIQNFIKTESYLNLSVSIASFIFTLLMLYNTFSLLRRNRRSVSVDEKEAFEEGGH